MSENRRLIPSDLPEKVTVILRFESAIHACGELA